MKITIEKVDNYYKCHGVVNNIHVAGFGSSHTKALDDCMSSIKALSITKINKK